MSRLYLLDSMFHIFRSFYSLPSTLKAEDGTPINAVFGVFGTLRNLWKTEPITHMVTVFESTSGTFRDDICAAYKQNRPEKPLALKVQVAIVKELCSRMGLPVWLADGYEADDVIGALAKRALADGMAVTIVSNDKDLAQLLALDGDIELMRIGGAGRSGIERVRKKDVSRVFGVEAHQIPSFLALRGDASDNIAGMPGVGPKTAAKWLSGRETLEDILRDPSALGERWSKLVAEHREGLIRDLELATIRTDIDFEAEGLRYCLDSFKPQPLDGLSDFFYSLSMYRQSREVGGLLGQDSTLEDLWSL